MIVITCLYVFESPGKKQDFVRPIHQKTTIRDCGPDPWNFGAQMDWESGDDGYPYRSWYIYASGSEIFSHNLACVEQFSSTGTPTNPSVLGPRTSTLMV
ncbi:hypothetical protein CEXT_668461 [Caerostris extrusa]|uniref:Uncharacterized protein n=1 Tax=Caerostris extrusa TaxID=172846 RepID=A0AAV4UBA3_CAEEX|nr:hypothetical protein CEXT_668461 [Caerostris extrusa]